MSVPTNAPVSLESGDHLTRDEFHRRYSDRPTSRRPSLWKGSCTCRHRSGLIATGSLMGSSSSGSERMLPGDPDLRFGDNATVILDDGNEVQPVRFSAPRARSGAAPERRRLHRRCPSIGGRDRRSLRLVRPVREERGLSPQRRPRVRGLAGARPEIDWFRLRDGEYVMVEPGADGVVESGHIPRGCAAPAQHAVRRPGSRPRPTAQRCWLAAKGAPSSADARVGYKTTLTAQPGWNPFGGRMTSVERRAVLSNSAPREV